MRFVRDELQPKPDEDSDTVLGHFPEVNFYNMLDYGRPTSGGDPTPSKRYRHLILLHTSDGCRLHIQITHRNLTALEFDKIKRAWVDFD